VSAREEAERERDAFMSTYNAVHDVLLGKESRTFDPTADAVAKRLAAAESALATSRGQAENPEFKE
jgi:hypothetical protein